MFHCTDIIQNTSAQQRKRLWWCPIGELSSLPLHAAGLWNGHFPETVSTFSITSYAPTLTILHRILSYQETTGRPGENLQAPRTLLVAQTDTADLPSLTDAALEVECVQALIPPTCLTGMPSAHDVTVQDALSAVHEAHIVHLACHGHQDQDNPMHNSLT
jgi:CHAT domain-containing protein